MASPEKLPRGTGSDQKLTAPSISLPKGGGAIRGIGEKFAANPITGTGAMSVLIATSPGRSGFGVGVAFAAGEPPQVLVGGPALPLAGELRVDLLVGHAAELTVVEFGQLVDHGQLQTEGVVDDAGRRDRSSEWADEDAIDAASLQGGRMAVRLRDAVDFLRDVVDFLRDVVFLRPLVDRLLVLRFRAVVVRLRVDRRRGRALAA